MVEAVAKKANPRMAGGRREDAFDVNSAVYFGKEILGRKWVPSV